MAVVVVAVAASLLFVVLGGGPGAPGTVRGAVPLDFAVDAVGPAGGGDPWSGVMVAGGDQVVRIGAAEPRLAITTFEAGRPVDAVAVTPFSWGDTPAVLTTGAELLALDVSLDGIDTKLRLWTDIAYAPVLSRASSRDEVVFFPAGDGGRSGLFVVRNMVDPDGVEVRELPRPVVVNAAVELDGYLFIGHGEGLLVVAMQGDCEAAVAEFGGAVDALALSLRDDGAATLTALDTSARALSVFELPGTLEEVAGCGLEWIPRLAGSIDLDPAAGYAPSVATVLDTAYLITTDGDVVLVDIADPAQGRTDRVRGSIVGLVDPEGPVAPAAVAQPHEDLPSVFVVDPGASLVWWIAPGGEESRSMRITPP